MIAYESKIQDREMRNSQRFLLGEGYIMNINSGWPFAVPIVFEEGRGGETDRQTDR